MGDKMQWYVVYLFYGIDILFIPVPTYHVAEVVYFDNMCDDTFNNIFVIFYIFVVSLAGCTVLG